MLVVGHRNGEIYAFSNDDAVLETDKKNFAGLTNEVGVVWNGGFLGLEIQSEFGAPGNNCVYTLTQNVELEGTDRFYLCISSFTLSVVPNTFD